VSPGGHLVTTAIAAGGGLAATGSVPLAAGIVVGGFLIDVDRLAHGFDTEALLGSEPRIVPADFWRSFFLGARLGLLERDGAAELGRPRGSLDDRERVHTGARVHGARRVPGARVEKRGELAPERLLAAHR